MSSMHLVNFSQTPVNHNPSAHALFLILATESCQKTAKTATFEQDVYEHNRLTVNFKTSLLNNTGSKPLIPEHFTGHSVSPLICSGFTR